MSFARVTVAGFIGKIERKKATSGKEYVQVSIPVGRKERDKETTNWYEARFWGRDADMVEQHFEKGKGIIVSGTLQCSIFYRKDGTAGLDLMIPFAQYDFPPTRRDEEASQSSYSVQSSQTEEDLGSDDIPF